MIFFSSVPSRTVIPSVFPVSTIVSSSFGPVLSPELVYSSILSIFFPELVSPIILRRLISLIEAIVFTFWTTFWSFFSKRFVVVVTSIPLMEPRALATSVCIIPIIVLAASTAPVLVGLIILKERTIFRGRWTIAILVSSLSSIVALLEARRLRVRTAVSHISSVIVDVVLRRGGIGELLGNCPGRLLPSPGVIVTGLVSCVPVFRMFWDKLISFGPQFRGACAGIELSQCTVGHGAVLSQLLLKIA